MRVIRDGHRYVLENFENKDEQGQVLQFIEKEPIPNGGGKMQTIFDGTTNEDVLQVLIDRISYLQDKFPCKENACCITHLQEGLHWLEARTADRLRRSVEGKHLA
jgi:hypothetical protein